MRLLRAVMAVWLAAMAAAAMVSTAARAQQIEADLTTHAINVETDFSGAKVALYGAVAGGAPELADVRPDIIIVVRGPKETLKVRRKRRIAGIWINTDRAKFENVPGYYTTLTNRPIAEIASFHTRSELGIGVSSVKTGLLLAAADDAKKNAGDYIEAIIRILGRRMLYQEADGGIEFIGKHLFRAEFELPANVPIGKYEADVYLFRNAELISQYTTRLTIEKSGLEQWIYSLAHQHPLLYGILSVLLAIAAGLAASTIFRKR